jgi:hypothetical protein
MTTIPQCSGSIEPVLLRTGFLFVGAGRFLRICYNKGAAKPRRQLIPAYNREG